MPNGSDIQIETRVVYISANTLLELSNSVGELYTREHLLYLFSESILSTSYISRNQITSV